MNRILALALLSSSLFAAESAITGTVTVFGGVKMLDESDAEPLENQTMLGALAAVVPRSIPVGLMVSAGASWDSAKTDEFTPGTTIEFKGKTTEILVGPVFYKRLADNFAAYAGGGLALISAEFEIKGPGGEFEDDDRGTGFFLAAGGQLLFKDNFGLGAHIGYSKADVEIFEETGDAGGLLLALAVGYHF